MKFFLSLLCFTLLIINIRQYSDSQIFETDIEILEHDKNELEFEIKRLKGKVYILTKQPVINKPKEKNRPIKRVIQHIDSTIVDSDSIASQIILIDTIK